MSSRAKWAALVGGLSLAALAAIVALLQGEFGDTHARVVLTSLGFSVFTATASAGDALRRRRPEGAGAVGTATVAVSAIAFVLLLVGLWPGELWEANEDVWRAFGIAGLLSLCGSHASIVLLRHRAADSPTVRAMVVVSIACSTFVTLVGTVALLGVVDDVSDGFVRVVATLLVVMVLTTVLPPILRQMDGTATAPDEQPALSPDRLAAELREAADRLERADSAAAVHREAAALRALAARAGRG